MEEVDDFSNSDSNHDSYDSDSDDSVLSDHLNPNLELTHDESLYGKRI